MIQWTRPCGNASIIICVHYTMKARAGKVFFAYFSIKSSLGNLCFLRQIHWTAVRHLHVDKYCWFPYFCQCFTKFLPEPSWKIAAFLTKLTKNKKSVNLVNVFRQKHWQDWQILDFLSILAMVRRGRVGFIFQKSGSWACRPLRLDLTFFSML